MGTTELELLDTSGLPTPLYYDTLHLLQIVLLYSTSEDIQLCKKVPTHGELTRSTLLQKEHLRLPYRYGLQFTVGLCSTQGWLV